MRGVTLTSATLPKRLRLRWPLTGATGACARGKMPLLALCPPIICSSGRCSCRFDLLTCFSCVFVCVWCHRAIQKNNPDWQKDPSASLNFPERAGEDFDSPGPDPRRWGAAVAQWASADMAMPRNHQGVVTPDCAGAGWSSAGGARSISVGGEASTPAKAKITPFHAKLMVASHHPIPSRSYYPGGLGMHGSGSEGDGSAQFHSTPMGLGMRGGGKGEMRSNVSKLLDLNLKGLAEACSAHASVCSSPISLLAALKKEEADNKASSDRSLGAHEQPRPKGTHAAKLPSPSNL